MSAYRVHKSKVRNQDSILEAIADLVARKNGIDLKDARELACKNVEFHDTPTNLYGYKGDVREDLANIVCRRDFVRRYMGGGASNDAGFLLTENGDYQAIISEYDTGLWYAKSAPRFWQVAMAQEAISEASAAGYVLHKVEENNQIKLEAVMVGTGGASHSGGW